MIVQGHQAVLHCVSDGLEHHVILVEVFTGLVCGIPRLVAGHVPQQAGQEDGLLHVPDGQAVPPHGQEEAVPVELDFELLHGGCGEQWEAVCSAKELEQTMVVLYDEGPVGVEPRSYISASSDAFREHLQRGMSSQSPYLCLIYTTCSSCRVIITATGVRVCAIK